MTTENPNTVTISKAQFDVFTRGLTLLDKLVNDPKNSTTFKKLAREAVPDAKLFPEMDIVEQATAPVNSRLEELAAENKKLREEMESDKKARDDEKALGSLKDQITAARKDYGLTDEGEQKLIERMRSTNSTDVEAAAAWVASKNPPPKPTTGNSYLPQDMNLFGAGEKSDDAEIKLLHTNPTKFFDMKTADILNHPENYPELAA